VVLSEKRTSYAQCFVPISLFQSITIMSDTIRCTPHRRFDQIAWQGLPINDARQDSFDGGFAQLIVKTDTISGFGNVTGSGCANEWQHLALHLAASFIWHFNAAIVVQPGTGLMPMVNALEIVGAC